MNRAQLIEQIAAAKCESDKLSNQAVIGGSVAGTMAVLQGGWIMYAMLAVVAIGVTPLLYLARYYWLRAESLELQLPNYPEQGSSK